MRPMNPAFASANDYYFKLDSSFRLLVKAEPKVARKAEESKKAKESKKAEDLKVWKWVLRWGVPVDPTHSDGVTHAAPVDNIRREARSFAAAREVMRHRFLPKPSRQATLFAQLTGYPEPMANDFLVGDIRKVFEDSVIRYASTLSAGRNWRLRPVGQQLGYVVNDSTVRGALVSALTLPESRLCSWCNEKPLPSGGPNDHKVRYCSDRCRTSGKSAGEARSRSRVVTQVE
jgi:hypothetical protein